MLCTDCYEIQDGRRVFHTVLPWVSNTQAHHKLAESAQIYVICAACQSEKVMFSDTEYEVQSIKYVHKGCTSMLI